MERGRRRLWLSRRPWREHHDVHDAFLRIVARRPEPEYESPPSAPGMQVGKQIVERGIVQLGIGELFDFIADQPAEVFAIDIGLGAVGGQGLLGGRDYAALRTGSANAH